MKQALYEIDKILLSVNYTVNNFNDGDEKDYNYLLGYKEALEEVKKLLENYKKK